MLFAFTPFNFFSNYIYFGVNVQSILLWSNYIISWPIYSDRCVEVLDLLESSLCKAMLRFMGRQQSSCSKSVTAATGQGDKCLSGLIRPQPHNPEWRFYQTQYADSKKCNNPPRVTLTLSTDTWFIPSLLSLFLWAVQTESGCANIVTAAPCQSDPQQYETQFSRLRSFLSGITFTFLLHSHWIPWLFPYVWVIFGYCVTLFLLTKPSDYYFLSIRNRNILGEGGEQHPLPALRLPPPGHGALRPEGGSRWLLQSFPWCLSSGQWAARHHRAAPPRSHRSGCSSQPQAECFPGAQVCGSPDGASLQLPAALPAERGQQRPLQGPQHAPAGGGHCLQAYRLPAVWSCRRGYKRTKLHLLGRSGRGGERGGGRGPSRDPTEWGGPGGSAGLHQESPGRPPHADHRVFLRLPPHGADVEHCRGLGRQPAAGRRLWQLHGEAVEPPSQKAEGQTASGWCVAHPPGLWRPGGGSE